VSNQLARDIAEIEQAAAALRRAEPALEPRAPEMPPGIEPRVSHSVWPLVCVIWLTAAMVVSCAIGTVVLLVGQHLYIVAFSDGKPDSIPTSAGAGIFLKML
jgi:hypothetical protein